MTALIVPEGQMVDLDIIKTMKVGDTLEIPSFMPPIFPEEPITFTVTKLSAWGVVCSLHWMGIYGGLYEFDNKDGKVRSL